jgi:purine-cytosine permease-like protein
MDQEVIAVGIVAVTFAFVLGRFFRIYLAIPLSEWLLRREKIRLAMWVRSQVLQKSGCTQCKN